MDTDMCMCCAHYYDAAACIDDFCMHCADRNLIPTDTVGFFRKWAEANPDVPSVDTVAGPLLNIIDESTREKEGGQFVHIDGSRLPW